MRQTWSSKKCSRFFRFFTARKFFAPVSSRPPPSKTHSSFGYVGYGLFCDRPFLSFAAAAASLTNEEQKKELEESPNKEKGKERRLRRERERERKRKPYRERERERGRERRELIKKPNHVWGAASPCVCQQQQHQQQQQQQQQQQRQWDRKPRKAELVLR